MKLINRKHFLATCGKATCAAAMFNAFDLFRPSGLYSRTHEDAFIRPAKRWRPQKDGAVECLLCPNACVIEEGGRGICRVRKNIKGSLYTLVYSRMAAVHMDPIEKKPFFHFMPGTEALSVATAGCNLSCKFCQNWEISQADPEDIDAERITPEKLASNALRNSVKTIAYTYNEPTVQYEYILDAALLAKKNGLKSVIISNGYISPEAGKELALCLDGVKIDLKAFSETFYQKICGGSLKAVLENIAGVFSTGRWLEIVVLVIPTLNDSPDEIKKMASWVRSNLSPYVPMHFTRFHAMYKIRNLPPTPVATLERCREIAADQGIRYAYVGNVAGHKWENTWCHGCGGLLIRRSGFLHVENRIQRGLCPKCGSRIPGVWY